MNRVIGWSKGGPLFAADDAEPTPPVMRHDPAYLERAALRDAQRAAQRCGIREGETLAELILRLYSETLSDTD